MKKIMVVSILVMSGILLLFVGCGNNKASKPENYKYKIMHNWLGRNHVLYTNTNDLHLNDGFITFKSIKDGKIYTLSGNLIIEHSEVVK